VLSSLPGTVRGYTVRAAVVSDGSSDRTTRIARDHDATIVEHPINQGQGGALIRSVVTIYRYFADRFDDIRK